MRFSGGNATSLPLISLLTLFVFLFSSPPTRSDGTSLRAKHAINKAAKKANHNRPRKSNPSDIRRKPAVYEELVKPPEYTLLGDDEEPPLDDEEFITIDLEGERLEPLDRESSIHMVMMGDEHVGYVAKSSADAQSFHEEIDWAKVDQPGMEDEPDEEDFLNWLDTQTEEDAFAWIEGKSQEMAFTVAIAEDFVAWVKERGVHIDNISDDELNALTKEYGELNPEESARKRLVEAGLLPVEGSEDGVGSLEEWGLPAHAELVDIVNDQELVFN